jgi:L-aminopeptidase/D-esterase-like protein
MTRTAGLGVAGVRVGHWTDSRHQTGCTVVEFPAGTVASYEARGGAPASRELELLRPDKSVTSVDAVLLTGGSAFGLAAAQGVMRYYEQIGRGVLTSAGAVPIIPALALYDLGVGDGAVRPAEEHGYLAARATRGQQMLSGRLGAGTGACVGHWRGPAGRQAAGLASHTASMGTLVVAVLCAVNAFGDIDPGDGTTGIKAIEALTQAFNFANHGMHTTIGVVCTNGRFSKADCRIIAQGAHDGLARAITPPHTRFDGDAFIAAATGEVDARVDAARFLALTAVCRAIRSLATVRPVPDRTGK